MTQDAESLIERLERLTELRGRDTVAAWSALARSGQWAELVAGLLEQHYDPLYRRSQSNNFSRHTDASKVALVHLLERLRAGGFVLLDTQFITPHLQRFGAIEIPRAAYHARLTEALAVPAEF